MSISGFKMAQMLPGYHHLLGTAGANNSPNGSKRNSVDSAEREVCILHFVFVKLVVKCCAFVKKLRLDSSRTIIHIRSLVCDSSTVVRMARTPFWSRAVATDGCASGR